MHKGLFLGTQFSSIGIMSMFLVQSPSHVWLFATLWTVAHPDPLSMGFFWQEYWSGLPLPPPGRLPDPVIEPVSPTLQVNSLLLSHQGNPSQCTFCMFFIAL